MNRLLLFLLLLISNLIFAQQQRKLDSLKVILAKLPAEGRSFTGDTTRVRVLCEVGEIAKNEDYFKQSIKISKECGWLKGEIISYYFYGQLLSNIGKIFGGIDFYYKSLIVAEKLHDNKYIVKNYRSLGDAYWLSEEYKKAIEMYEKALLYINQKLEAKLYLLCLNNIGLVHYKLKDFSKALAIFNKCFLGAKGKNDSLSQSYYLGNIGAAYRELGKLDEALFYLHQAEFIENKIPDLSNNDRAFANIEIARAYYLKKDYKTALKYANKARKSETDIDSYTKISIYNTLYQIYKSLNNNKLSLIYLEKYNELKSLSDKQDFDRRLKGLQFEYDNQKQQLQIQGLNQTQRFLAIGLSIIVLFLIGFLISNRLLRKKNHQIEKQRQEIFELNQNLEQKVVDRTKELSFANAELLRKNDEIMSALVKGQTIERKRVAIELHDNLGGMLSGMKWRLQALNKEQLSEKEQKVYDGILKMMSDAYSEVRLISHNLLPAELEKSGLRGAIQKLANDINQSEKIQVLVDFGENDIKIDKKIELELYGICLELINNILKHANATEVNITLKKDVKNINLSIKDNGIGIDSSKLKNDGMGIDNIKKRIASINGTLEIISKPNQGTEMKISC